MGVSKALIGSGPVNLTCFSLWLQGGRKLASVLGFQVFALMCTLGNWATMWGLSFDLFGKSQFTPARVGSLFIMGAQKENNSALHWRLYFMGREKTALKSVIINYCPLVCPLFLGLLFFFMQSAQGGQEEEIQDRKQEESSRGLLPHQRYRNLWVHGNFLNCLSCKDEGSNRWNCRDRRVGPEKLPQGLNKEYGIKG